MSESKHTPGPWRLSTDEVPFPNVMGGEDHHEVACVGHHIYDAFDIFTPERGPSFEEHEANARLIAAAPDLLEALDAVRCYVADLARGARLDGCQHVQMATEDLARLDAAIAKATGGEA